MEGQERELIKTREILFSRIGDHDYAHEACQILQSAQGIQSLERLHEAAVAVVYDIRLITLRIMEQALFELGLHLDNSLLHKIKRSLYYYTEETQLINLGLHDHLNASTLEVFINRYLHTQHGCRDTRPRHLRKYL